MPGPGHAQLAQGLVGLTIEAAESQRDFEAQVYGLSAQDMIQNVQLPVSGRVGRKAVLTETTVNFPYPLLLRVAPGATESDLTYPHIVHGIQMLAAPQYVSLDVQVIDFPETQRGFLERARLQVVAFAPDAPKKVSFRALIHLSIMGYAAPTELDAEG